MKKNKGKALAAALAAASMLVTSTAFAATRANDGTLTWDFESTNDVAYFTDWDNTNDTIDSGAWHCTYVKKHGIYGSPHVVQYADCPLSDPALALPEINPIPTDGGNGFAYVKTHQNAWAQSSALGMSIKLSDTQLVPGRSYMIGADIYQTTSWGIDTFVACTKPSDFNTTRTDWTKSTNRTYLSHQKTDGTWATSVAKEEGWVRVIAEFTPSADMYENGSVILNIGNWSTYEANKFICFDNIKIAPADRGWYTDPMYKEPFSTQIRYGKNWDFEDDTTFKTGRTSASVPAGKEDQFAYDITLTKAPGDYEDGTWSAFPGYKNSYQEPRVINTVDYTATNRYASAGTSASIDRGYHGASPAGQYSIRCASRTDWGGNDLVGARLRLNKNDWLKSRLDYPSGTAELTDAETSYTFRLKASNNTGSYATGFKGGLCAFVVPEEADNSANGYEQVKGWYDNARKEGTLITLGELEPYWREYTANITLKPEDFNSEGYAELIVLALFNKDLPDKLGDYFPLTYLYLDDISLIRSDENVSIIDYMGKNMNIDITNVCLQEIPNVLLAVTHRDADTGRMLSVSCNNKTMSGIYESNLSIPITGDLTKNPATYLYMWRGDTLAPIPVGRDLGNGNAPIYTTAVEDFNLSN
ncbi:MAG: hypothetical protein PUF72_06940 [Clostridiales bacterium]|nr:hypothetical protein [Clostridiales bacterium]